MKSIELNIREELGSPSALTREQGEIIYSRIYPVLKSGGDVTLDFGEIESIITPFLNVAIGKLYKDFSSDQLNEHLQISNATNSLYSKMRMVIENAKRFYKDQDNFTNTVKETINLA